MALPMVDDKIVLIAERLRDDLSQLKLDLKHRYPNKNRQVTADELRMKAARLAETWMINLAEHPEVTYHIDRDYLANLNIHFQRSLVLCEKSSKRIKYDTEINDILQRFTLDFIIPLKRLRSNGGILIASNNFAKAFEKTIFVGHSFSPSDQIIIDPILNFLRGLGFVVVTGEKPKADRISEKIKTLIDRQYCFLGIFTCRDKIARRQEWTTSSWVLDEKAFAVGKGKKLVLLKEIGVGSIGGIQGDYEYIEFDRQKLELLFISILEIFDISVAGFRE
jgi:hypothetical protein